MPRLVGFLRVPVKVWSSGQDVFRGLDLLVDTGSTYSWVPATVLGELSVEPARVEGFETVDGAVLRRPIGDVVMEIEGVRSHVPVAFGLPGDEPLLGVTALEILGFEVDPVKGRLRKARLLSLATPSAPASAKA